MTREAGRVMANSCCHGGNAIGNGWSGSEQAKARRGIRLRRAQCVLVGAKRESQPSGGLERRFSAWLTENRMTAERLVPTPISNPISKESCQRLPWHARLLLTSVLVGWPEWATPCRMS